MDSNEKNKASNQPAPSTNFESIYKLLTSKSVKKASDAVFNASGEDLRKAFKPDA